MRTKNVILVLLVMASTALTVETLRRGSQVASTPYATARDDGREPAITGEARAMLDHASRGLSQAVARVRLSSSDGTRDELLAWTRWRDRVVLHVRGAIDRRVVARSIDTPSLLEALDELDRDVRHDAKMRELTWRLAATERPIGSTVH